MAEPQPAQPPASEGASDVPVTAPARSALGELKKRLQERGAGKGGSMMRYNPFNIFDAKVTAIVPLPNDDDPTKLYNVTTYIHQATSLQLSILERREASGTRSSDFTTAHSDGIDNTGIFHWPAEEILAHVLLTHNPSAFQPEGGNSDASVAPLNILELGCGVALAGLAYAVAHPEATVCLTDGNRGVVNIVKENVQRLGLDKSRVSAMQLLWHEATHLFEGDLLSKIDVIVGADCLFFDAYHDALVAMLLRALRLPRPSGRRPLAVLMIAPTRGTTFQRFVEKMGAHDDVALTVTRDYDAGISATHAAQEAQSAPTGYVPDRHYPIMLRIERKTNAAAPVPPSASDEVPETACV